MATVGAVGGSVGGMSVAWPPITDPLTLARWRAADEELSDHLAPLLVRLAERMPPGSTTPTPQLAFDYPFGRADGQVILDSDGPRPAPADEIRALQATRTPVLAIGANGSPTRLGLKLRAVDDPTCVLTPATISGVDICACPVPAAYGSLPAGMARSPGTAAEVVIADHTDEQIEWLALTEFGYRLVRLTGTTVKTADGREIVDPLAFVQRLGLFAIDGAPVPLAAVGATGRRWPALTQAQLITECATRLGCAPPTADGLLAELFADAPAFLARHTPTLLARAIRGAEPDHERYPC